MLILHTRTLLLWTSFCITLLSVSSCRNKPSPYNLDFEKQHAQDNLPEGWKLRGNDSGNTAQTDTRIYYGGKQSLHLTKTTAADKYILCSYKIPASFTGERMELSGYIKTKNLSDGNVRLFLTQKGDIQYREGVSFNQSQPISGTTDWNKYTLTLNYDANNADTIIVGILYNGTGEIWLDELQMQIDGKDLLLAKAKPAQINVDSMYNTSSHIAAITLTPLRIKQLANLGQIWGFVKYHHPTIAAGNVNWDAALFRLLPSLLAQQSDSAVYQLIENQIDSLGFVPALQDPITALYNLAYIKPDYGTLFQPGNLPSSLIQKLAWIRDNHHTAGNHYYVKMPDSTSLLPHFTHEGTYGNNTYPDAGLRLLALYRFWSVIQYYFPSRYLIPGNWCHTLPSFIPAFVNARNEEEYLLSCLKLIASIHDTHAQVYHEVLENKKGQYIAPFPARFVENRLVVTGNAHDTAVKGLFIAGDIIEAIDGTPVSELIKKYQPLTPASNNEVQLREMTSSRGFLLRSTQKQMQIRFIRNGLHHIITAPTLPAQATFTDSSHPHPASGYQLLDNEIGYIFPERLSDGDLPAVKKLFADAKGIILDMRCYPGTFMPFEYGKWLKPQHSAFAIFSHGSLALPGSFHLSKPVSNGGNDLFYESKNNRTIIIIADATTLSQAEYTVMAFSNAPATVIGSTTAGADGDVTRINLPGGVQTYFSGLGIYYPDYTPAQRVGVKIDIPVKPTIKGVKEHRDELLEKAIELIKR